MLDGVKIISQYDYSYNNNTGFAISVAIFVGLLMTSITEGMFAIASANMRPLGAILIAMTIMAGFFSNYVYSNTVKHFFIYTVTIDDSVRFNDFYSKYEILEEMDCTVFKIRDREQQK